jgi:hypothetical protein
MVLTLLFVVKLVQRLVATVRQQLVLAPGEGGFGVDPTRFDGCRRPDHDGDPGGGNLFGNSLMEFVSRQELSIPPDREASHFKITGEVARGLRCLLGIGNKKDRPC